MIPVPTEKRELLSMALDLVEKCRVSVGTRASYYRIMNTIAETGRFDGTKSLVNLLYKHLDRTAALLYSPIELKFAVDFENSYPRNIIDRGQVAANALTRAWGRSNADVTFGRGVFDALKYGATFLKQWPQYMGEGSRPTYKHKLVMPWQFGVYREDENDLDEQSCLCETVTLTMPEVWQRIYHLPDAEKMFKRIKAHGQTGDSNADPQSFFHQVLSASTLATSGVQNGAIRPGGIVQLNNDPNYSIMAPVLGVETVPMHELWVQGEDDYTTIQIIEPDVIIAPRFKKANLLIQGSRRHPYTKIQPNEVTNWLWGRSELVDLIEPQYLLSVWCDDARRLSGLQVDKILAFVGESGVTDEIYGQFRESGYVNLGQGASVNDLTPKFPAELLQMIKFVIDTINTLGSFPNILQGQGEAGVRAGVHAATLLKTASPTLRDRALLIERQCAMAGDLLLAIKEAKEEQFYWTKGAAVEDVEKSRFLLSELPDDWRVTVDSHSSSPIFSDENAQLIFAGAKMGVVDGDYVLDNMPFPNKELAKAALRAKEEANQQFMQQLMQSQPELSQEMLKKRVLGRK